MKNILCLMLIMGVLFFACKKEEDNNNDNNSNTTTYAFSCKLGSFSQRATGDIIQFSAPGMGVVTQEGITYSNTYFPPYDGTINISELNTIEGTISATFNFRANELENFQSLIVTEGKLDKVNF